MIAGEEGVRHGAPAFMLWLDALPTLIHAELEQQPAERIAAVGMERAALDTWLYDRIAASLASGRAARVILGTGRWEAISPEAQAWYVGRVVRFALQELPGLTALAQGEHAAWQQLRDWLRARAYPLVARLVLSEASAPEVDDFVQVACLAIDSKLEQFPCDSPLNAWLMVILRNTVLARVMRSRDLLDREAGIASLDQSVQGQTDALLPLAERLPDAAQGGRFHQVELRLLLADAVGRLQSEQQRDALLYTYFHELPDRDIARHLGTTQGNVAQLRRRALRRLRFLLDGERGEERRGA